MNTGNSKEDRRQWKVGALALLFFSVLFLAFGVESSGAQQGDEPIDRSKISQGAGLFRAWCRACHGEDATGSGPMAEHLRTPPADLTKLAEKEAGVFYFGRVKAKIDGREAVKGHGSSDMPVWGEAFLVIDEEGGEEAVRMKIDNLAHYLRSIQATTKK